MLSGCKSSIQLPTIFDDYLTRLGRVLNSAPPKLAPTAPPSLPRKRELQLELTDIRMGLLESYQLKQCGLFDLIAERNSILGKVADRFSRFDYEIAFLAGLERCITDKHIDSLLISDLEQIKFQKRNNIHKLWHNILFVSNAMRAQKQANQWINPDIDTSRVVSAFSLLQQNNTAIISKQWHSITPIIDLQETLEKEPVIGRLHYSLLNLSHDFEALNAYLRDEFPKVVCTQGRDRTQYRYLNNVLTTVFIERLQPNIAKLDRIYYQLAPYLDKLAINELKVSHQRFHHVVAEHIALWQTLRSRCQ